MSYSILPEASNQSPPGVNRPDEIKRSLNERASTRRVTTSEPLLRYVLLSMSLSYPLLVAGNDQHVLHVVSTVN